MWLTNYICPSSLRTEDRGTDLDIEQGQSNAVTHARDFSQRAEAEPMVSGCCQHNANRASRPLRQMRWSVDQLLTGATIIDGTGASRRSADLLIRDVYMDEVGADL